ncbi:MFS transporter [Sphingomonas sp. BN140010]|uniref:MFS transporter n=1 Tax=Sphingomonas arvum TaxID=2992113 RepID=A0ABT3JBP2_9SPHN|nr:MFS transporter [Sphingomonas sp. BN140010]MCW3796479.1 MFS transporter [Sphingomonas sp. BN140010]
MSRAALPRTVWVLGFVSLLMDLSSEIIHALLPLFITVTLGASVAVLGAIDGVAEATASFAKLASGRLSDRNQRRKPWILLGYGLAAATKPLFALAGSPLTVLGARLVDRTAKGIRGAPRDAMLADETAPEIRGAAYGLRQSLDTMGAFLAPLAAVALMWALAQNIRAVFWMAVIPGIASVTLAWLALREPARHAATGKPQALLHGFRQVDRSCRLIIAVAFVFTLARCSESFLILKGADAGLSPTLAPLTLVLFNLAYLLLSYPAGALSDRRDPRLILAGGIAMLVAGDLVLAFGGGLITAAVGVALWGGHMALTQGLFARLIADAAPERLRATTFGLFHFATGVAALLASLAAGWLWEVQGPAATFIASAGVAAVSALLLPTLRARTPSAR